MERKETERQRNYAMRLAACPTQTQSFFLGLLHLFVSLHSELELRTELLHRSLWKDCQIFLPTPLVLKKWRSCCNGKEVAFLIDASVRPHYFLTCLTSKESAKRQIRWEERYFDPSWPNSISHYKTLCQSNAGHILWFNTLRGKQKSLKAGPPLIWVFGHFWLFCTMV